MQKGVFWKHGDWGAYFGLLANNLINFFSMAALLVVTVGFPPELVYGKIAPAFGLSLLVGSIFYAVAGYNLMKNTGRTDVTALPSGPSAPSLFIVVFLVILPLYKQTGNVEFAWMVGVGWCFLEGLIELSGAFIGGWLRKIVPRTVLLSALAGLGLLLLAMNPILQSFETPMISFVILAIIFINWFGKSPIFSKIPTGFLVLLVGTVLSWIFGLQDPAEIQKGMTLVGFNLPTLQIKGLMDGIKHALPYLVSAIPLGLTNFIFTLENIESAAAAGDEYNTKNIMLANGISSLIGCLFGSPFPTTVYIGHPGWKSIGAGIGYTVATGLSMFIISIFGIGGLLLAFIPLSSVLPVLYYIGIVVAIQAVRESPVNELPVVFVSLFPWIANWALTLVNNVLSSAGTNVATLGVDKLLSGGVYYNGLFALGTGAPLSSIVWGCIAIFSINNLSLRGCIAALTGAALTFFGVIHAANVGVGQALPYFYAYLMVAAIFLAKHIAGKKYNSDKEKFETDFSG